MAGFWEKDRTKHKGFGVFDPRRTAATFRPVRDAVLGRRMGRRFMWQSSSANHLSCRVARRRYRNGSFTPVDSRCRVVAAGAFALRGVHAHLLAAPSQGANKISPAPWREPRLTNSPHSSHAIPQSSQAWNLFRKEWFPRSTVPNGGGARGSSKRSQAPKPFMLLSSRAPSLLHLGATGAASLTGQSPLKLTHSEGSVY